jgi:hypothetical protein
MAGIATTDYMNADFIYLMEADVFDPVNKNLLKWSDNLSESVWTTTNASVAASSKTDPDGNTDAWKLTATSTGSSDRVVQRFYPPASMSSGGSICVKRIAMQADSSSPSDTLAFTIDDFTGATYLTPDNATLVYGPGEVSIDTSNKLITVSGLSTATWTEIEVVWFDMPARSVYDLLLFPGGYATNSGAVHVFRPHVEEGGALDGRGFRSRGARKTEAYGAGRENETDPLPDGQAVTVRRGTETYITLPTDTPANTVFTEGLLNPFSISVSGGGLSSLINGVATSKAGNSTLSNVNNENGHLLEYDFFGRPVRYYRGLRDAAFSTFDKIYEGFGGQPFGDRNKITIPLTDPLYALGKTMEIPKFKGFGQCVRLDGTGDYIEVSESPDCWILGDLTIQARFRRYNLSGNTQEILVQFGSGDSSETEADNYCYSLELNESVNAALVLNHEYGSGTDENINSGAASIDRASTYDGEWHSVAAVRDDTAKTVSFYYDNELISVTSYTNSPTGAYDGKLFIGGGYGYNLSGDIDDIKIWSKVLTPDEVAALSNTPIEAGDHWDNDLRAYYKLDEGIGSLTWDEMTNLQELRMRECYLSFDGSSDKITLAHHADHAPTAASITVEVLVATYNDLVNHNYLVFKNNCFRILHNKTTGKLQVGVYTDGATGGVGDGWRDAAASSAYSMGQDGFQLVTLRWTESTGELAIFIDGTDKVTGTWASDSFNPDPSTVAMYLGSQATSTYSRAWIGELRIWHEARSDAEILASAFDVLTGAETNLKLWYTFDENKASSNPAGIGSSDGSDADYAKTTLYDRQNSDSDKKDGTVSGPTWCRTTGGLQADAHFVGTGEGYQDLMGKRKPYAAGTVHNIPLILVDPLNLVYYATLPPVEEFLNIREGGKKLLHTNIGSEDDIWDFDFTQYPDKAYVHYTGADAGNWSDESGEVDDDTTQSQILHSTNTSGLTGDGLYIGHASKFSTVHVLMYATLGNINATDVSSNLVLSWQFWNGEDWEDLRGLVDGTSGLRKGTPLSSSEDKDITDNIPTVFTKISADGTYWNSVAIVRWQMPDTWVKDSINDIETLSIDSTDRWWIRCAATSNATGYEVAPEVSVVWVSNYDAVVDADMGFVKVASVPYYPLTVDLKGDNTGAWVGTGSEVTQLVIDRWSENSNYSYATGFTSKGPDVIVGNYSGTNDITIKNFLTPILKGIRSVLFGDRNGDLDIATIANPDDQSSTVTIVDEFDQIFSLEKLASPPPVSGLRLGYRKYHSEFSESDLNVLLPYSQRKDLLSDFRWLDRSTALSHNEGRYAESQPQDIETAIVSVGSTDTIETEATEWSDMIGSSRGWYRLKIPMGVDEYTLGTVFDVLATNFNLWDGVSANGKSLYVMDYNDNAKNETTVLLLWG